MLPEMQIPLDPLAYQLSMTDEKQCANIVVSAQLDMAKLAHDDSGGVLQTRLPKALEYLIRKYEVLSYKLGVSSRDLCFTAVEDAVSSMVIEGLTESEYAQRILAEIDRPFAIESYPLIRCVYIKESLNKNIEDKKTTESQAVQAIGLIVSHVVADATAAMALLIDLLAYIFNNEVNIPLPAKHLFKPLYPRLPKAHRGLSGKFLAYRHYFTYLKRIKYGKNFPGFTSSITSERKLSALAIDLNMAQLTQLKRQAKYLNVEVNDILRACWLVCSRNLYSEEGSIPLSYYHSVDLRKHLNEHFSDADVGLFGGTIMPVVNVEKLMSVAELAATINQQVKSLLKSGAQYSTWNLLPPKLFFPPTDKGRTRYQELIYASLKPTCGALLNIDADNILANYPPDLPINKLSFLGIGSMPLPFFVAITYFQSTLNINVVFSELMIDEKKVRAFVQLYERILLETISGIVQSNDEAEK